METPMNTTQHAPEEAPADESSPRRGAGRLWDRRRGREGTESDDGDRDATGGHLPEDDRELDDEGPSDINWRGVAVAFFLLFGGLSTYGVLKVAGEQHYQGCVSAIDARYGQSTSYITTIARNRALAQCSRSPF
jgi:hypothetical protein